MEFKRPQHRKYQEESSKALQGVLKQLSDSKQLGFRAVLNASKNPTVQSAQHAVFPLVDF